MPISSLIACKRVIVEPLRASIAAARERENAAFVDLLGGPANIEALAAFAEGRDADFSAVQRRGSRPWRSSTRRPPSRRPSAS